MAVKRRAARTDSNQAEIVRGLARIPGVGVRVIETPVDLLVAYKGENHLIEIKTDDGQLSASQRNFIGDWPGPVHVCRSLDDCLRTIGIE